MNCRCWVAIASILVMSLPVIAEAQFYENFDSYATGSSMHGVNGWKGWDNDPFVTAYTSDDQAQSNPNSVAIEDPSDLVHEFSGIDSGTWVVTAHQYIPNDMEGTHNFILLNTYSDGGTKSWSTVVRFALGLVTNSADAASMPLVLDQWAEIRVEIDFGLDSQSIYYDGVFLTTTGWTNQYGDGGALNLGAMDLLTIGGTEVYYDDISIERGTPTPINDESWGTIKAVFR